MKKLLKGVHGKQILISGLAVMVVIAGYYRWTIDRKGETVAVMTDTVSENEAEAKTDLLDVENEDGYGDYFAKARYERDCARSEETELIKASAQEGEEGSELAVKNAEKLEVYAKNMADETAIENMVIAKGYQDCVAFVDESGVKVVVKSDTLDFEGVAQIKDIVVEQTGVKTTEIKISNKE